MFKRLSFYLPGLGQSWMFLIVFIVGSLILGVIVMAPLMLLFPNHETWSQALLYPLSFVPIVIFAYYMIKDRWRKGAILVYKEKYIDKTTKANNDDTTAANDYNATIMQNRVPVAAPTTVKEVMQIVPDSEIEAVLPSIPMNRPNFGKIGAIATFILLIPLTISLSIVIEPIMSWWEMPDIFKEIFENLMNGNVITTFLTLAIMAPLFEEWLCRGVIMRGLMYNLNPTKAILWSALIFGVMHMNPWQSVPAFLIGILLGWLYWRTRSIWVPIFVHFINNGTSYLISILYPDISMDASIRDLLPGNQYYILYLVAFILLAAIITLMHKNYDKPVIPAKIPTDT